MFQARVRLRPHHLMCVHGFKGNGYSPVFVENFWRVLDRLKDGEVEIELVPGTQDALCQPCPNNLELQGKGYVCAEESKIRKLDDAYVETLEVRPGDVLRWNDVKKLIVKKVTDEAFEKNCEPCGWKKLGFCKTALEALRC